MIRAGIRRAFSIVGRRRWEREVEEEIKLHLALRVEQLMADGVSRDDAYQEAVRRFGPLTESRARMLDAARQREQHMRRTEYFADLRQDLSFALRTLRRQKGWTAVTVLTLALGVGASTAVFSVVSSLLIHAVPYPNADRVMLVYQQLRDGSSGAVPPNGQLVTTWKQGSHSFESIERYLPGQMRMSTAGVPEQVNTARIEPTFLSFAGVQPIAGRMFNDGDIAAGEHVAVLSEGFWKARLGGRKDVVGQQITLDSSLYTVVGVVPTKLRGPRVGATREDIWLPFEVGGRGGPVPLQVVGRLRPGIRPDVAARELDTLFAHVANFNGPLPLQTIVMPPAKRLGFYDSLVMLAFAVGLVLLVACANVAHLLMARASGRQRELAIRTALGAGRGRVLRQLLTESLLLAFTGTAMGVLVGWIGMKTLITLRPDTLKELAAVQLDLTTLGMATLVAVATAILFGFAGAVQAGRIATHDALKSTSTNVSRGGRIRARTLLVVSEMALSATLVVGATMLVRSLINLQNADLGFEPKGLYSLGVSGIDLYGSAERARVMRTLMTRLAATRGIQSVALATNPTTFWAMTIGNLEVEGKPPLPVGIINRNRVGSSYLKTMNMRIVQGRSFTDTTDVGQQVIVNENFARKQWPGVSAVGQRVRIRSSEQWLTVVGTVADPLTGGAMRETTQPILFTPAADSSDFTIMIRTAGAADPIAPVQALVRSVDPGLKPTLNSVETQMAETTAAPRFIMLLLSSFTVLALVLAAIGLYGVMSYSVAERTREIGIRVALGATRSRVARLVLTSGIGVALMGSVVGMVAARWGTTLIERQLYGIARSDVVSFGAAMVVLFLAAVVACVVPTRRALAVDPMTAIRAD